MNVSLSQSSREKCGVFRRKSREFVMLRTLRGSITKYQLTRSFPHSHAHNLDRPSHSSKSKFGSVLSQWIPRLRSSFSDRAMATRLLPLKNLWPLQRLHKLAFSAQTSQRSTHSCRSWTRSTSSRPPTGLNFRKIPRHQSYYIRNYYSADIWDFFFFSPHRTFTLLSGMSFVFFIFRILKSLNFQERMGLVTRTLAVAFSDLWHFFILYLPLSPLLVMREREKSERLS